MVLGEKGLLRWRCVAPGGAEGETDGRRQGVAFEHPNLVDDAFATDGNAHVVVVVHRIHASGGLDDFEAIGELATNHRRFVAHPHVGEGGRGQDGVNAPLGDAVAQGGNFVGHGVDDGRKDVVLGFLLHGKLFVGNKARVLFQGGVLDRAVLPAVAFLLFQPGIMGGRRACIRIGKVELDAIDGALFLPLGRVLPGGLAVIGDGFTVRTVRLVADFGDFFDVFLHGLFSFFLGLGT